MMKIMDDSQAGHMHLANRINHVGDAQNKDDRHNKTLKDESGF